MISWKVENEKFCTKTKNLKLGSKKPFLNVLDWNLKKLISFLKTTPSNLSKYHKSSKTTTITATTKNRTKIPLFGYFWAGILKNYCHIWNQHPQICQLAKFREKTKMPKFGTKNVLFVIFNQECLIWVFFCYTFKKLLWYLKSAPSNWSNCKLLQKNKNA